MSFDSSRTFHDFEIIVILELKRSPVDGFSAGLVEESDIYKWEVLVMGPPDTL